MHISEEALLEPIARYFRYMKGVAEIPKNKPLILADIGCGPKIRFYKFAQKNQIKIKQYFGIDPLAQDVELKNVRLIRKPMSNAIPLPSGSVDILTGFAVLEHLNNPEDIMNDIFRVLKKDGKAIFTTPSKKSKKILEILCYKFNLISRRELEEHKGYFDKESILKLIKTNKKQAVFHSYFEFGWNNLIILKKLPD
ncbi:MAG: class I SAM-dependent methyltransferase [Microgenomates group bacterium]|jgi:SAM-dependent methyltransferase